MRNVVVVLAHPDDETFICGGTMAKFAAEGDRVTLVCATKGEMGRRLGVPVTATRETLWQLREQELREACSALGIERLVFLGLRDKTLEIQPSGYLKARVLHWLRELQADVVVTFHERLGGHPDHCAIGAAATSAYLLWEKEHRGAQLSFITWENVASRPERHGFSKAQVQKIDVTPYARAKFLAFRAHRTQSQMNDWLWRSEKEGIARLTGHEYQLLYRES
ncbi:MAG: PIG-L family deacetylase [Firmicutes bacterium]|nr:PIG-L family deacetylase [Bacillota bacterium]